MIMRLYSNKGKVWFLHLKSVRYSYMIRYVKAFSVSVITSDFKALIDWKDMWEEEKIIWSECKLWIR